MTRRMARAGAGAGVRAVLAIGVLHGLGCAPDLGVAPRPGEGGSGGMGAGGAGVGGAGSGGNASEGGLPIWGRAFGGEGDQAGVAVAADAAGNLVVVGQLGGSADFGGETLESAGSDDVFVAWLDGAGEVTRTLRLGDGNPQEVHALALTGDGGVLLGGAMSGTMDFGGETWTSAGGRDGYVAKLGADGAPAWGLRFGDAGYQAVTGVAEDVAGNVLLSGTISGGAVLGDAVQSAGGYDVLVAKLSAQGAPLWSRSFGGALDQRVHGMAADAGGGAVVVGEFAGSLDLGGEVLVSAGAEDAFVARVGAGGDVLWGKRFGDAKVQAARCVGVDGEGRVVIGGEFAGSLDLGGGPLAGSGVGGLFVGVLDGNGEHVWSRGFPGSGASRLEALAVDGEGGIAITGVLAGSLEMEGETLVSIGADDLFMARFDAGGRMRWARRAGYSGKQQGAGVAVDGAGDVVVTGLFGDGIQIGEETIAGGDGYEALVVKLAR